MANQSVTEDAEAARGSSADDQNQPNPPNPPKPLATKEELLLESIRAGRDDLVYKANTKTTLNLATLQRLFLFHLRVDIIEDVGNLFTPGGQAQTQAQVLQGLRKSVADYTQAIRDWELMVAYNQKARGRQSRDPFCISGGNLIAKAFDLAGLTSDAEYGAARLETQIGSFGQRGRANKDQRLKAFLRRFVAAMFGALTLIGPMLLMVLHKDRATDLSTTSVSVVIVAGVLAWGTEASPETVVSVVAAYTAVLVVFVGTLQT